MILTSSLRVHLYLNFLLTIKGTVPAQHHHHRRRWLIFTHSHVYVVILLNIIVLIRCKKWKILNFWVDKGYSADWEDNRLIIILQELVLDCTLYKVKISKINNFIYISFSQRSNQALTNLPKAFKKLDKLKIMWKGDSFSFAYALKSIFTYFFTFSPDYCFGYFHSSCSHYCYC